MIGPHFWFDLIRLPRKGWSTFFRTLYLVILLVGLGIMYEARRHTITNPASYASFAQDFAYTLIIMQYVLVLVLLPVYVGSAIAEERENQTLEALFATPLTDRQIVEGKYYSRVLHLLTLVLASVPLLAFMYMWGNVPIPTLVFHTLNTVLLAISASSLCILVSCKSETVFAAVTQSYPLVFALAVVSLLFACTCFQLDWGKIDVLTKAAMFALTIAVLTVGHLALAWRNLDLAIRQMNQLRTVETKPKHKQQAKAFSLADSAPPTVRTRQGRMLGSYIHRLALPIREPALFWKECLKDGTTWSLTISWFGYFALIIAGVCLASQLLIDSSKFQVTTKIKDFQDVRVYTSAFGYTSYFVSLTAYFLVVVFQTTISVAGERERNTLEFLLLLPVERREIIFSKWLGPLWKNWPLLAVSYLGVLLGVGTLVFSPSTALTLLLIPWPALLMCSCLGMLLSVWCRRTLFANIVMAGFLVMIFVVHLLGDRYLLGLMPAYAWLLLETTQDELAAVPAAQGVPLVLAEQGVFLFAAVVFGCLAYYSFTRTDYQGKI